MDRPRVYATMEHLGQMVARAAGDAFAFVGPELEDGAGIRVALSSGIDRFDAAMLARLPDLETIVVFGAGQSGIDRDVVAQRGLRVDAAGATHAGDVAEHGVAMILALRRSLVEADRWVRSGDWGRLGRIPRGHRLSGARVGIVGLGNIGSAAEQRLAALGCEIAWWGPRDKPDAHWPRLPSIEALARWSDILVVAVFAHDDTRGLIDGATLDALGPEGMLVNLSRGFVVDEDALIAALRERRLGQAALDVFAEEPTPPARWADVPNLLVSPHSAGDTHESVAALVARAATAIAAALQAAPATRTNAP